MKFEEFLLKYNGAQNVGNTAENRGECTGLFAVYAESLGLPFTWGHAMDIFANADEQFYEKILNTPEAIPQQGDCVVWNKGFNGTFGHIGIATGGAGTDIHKFEVFEQNVDWGSCRLFLYNNEYESVIGWLRPRTQSAGVDPVILAQSDAFIAICTKLSLPANRDVVLGELDKLIGYEDKLIEKDKQLSEAQTKAEVLQSSVASKETELKSLQDQLKNLTDEVAIAVAENKHMSEEIGQLKKDCKPAPILVGWRKILYDILMRL